METFPTGIDPHCPDLHPPDMTGYFLANDHRAYEALTRYAELKRDEAEIAAPPSTLREIILDGLALCALLLLLFSVGIYMILNWRKG